VPVLEPPEARRAFAAAPVVRLATSGADGRPHLVPVVAAVSGDRVVFAVDAKPKTTHRLRRLANIRANPAVCLLADHYEEDWTRLWWARADGTARVLAPPGESRAAAAHVRLLAAAHPQYAGDPPRGPVVEITVSRWSGWRAR
jgi:PPOX class probable F420-dependent enzyme